MCVCVCVYFFFFPCLAHVGAPSRIKVLVSSISPGCFLPMWPGLDGGEDLDVLGNQMPFPRLEPLPSALLGPIQRAAWTIAIYPAGDPA